MCIESPFGTAVLIVHQAPVSRKVEFRLIESEVNIPPPRRNKKSLKLSLGLLIETSLANLTTDSRNDLTNILWIIRITIPT